MKPLLLIAALSVGSAYTIRQPGSETDKKHGLIARMPPPRPNVAEEDNNGGHVGSGIGGNEDDGRGNTGGHDYQPLGEGESGQGDLWNFDAFTRLLDDIPRYGFYDALDRSNRPPLGSVETVEIIENQRVVTTHYEAFETYTEMIPGGHPNSQPVQYSRTTSVRTSVREEASQFYQRIERRPGITFGSNFRTEQLQRTPGEAALSAQNQQPLIEVTSTEYRYEYDAETSTRHETVWNTVPQDNIQGVYDLLSELEPLIPPPGHPEEQHNQRRRRRSVATTISKQEVGGASANSTADHAAQFRQYLAAYQAVQRNISDSIFPVFDLILNKTDSQIVHEMCWSVYSDLTRLGPKIIGPFSYGMTNFDWMEDQYVGNKTSITSMAINSNTDPKILSLLATNQMLANIYQFVWSNTVTAANRTGLLPIMDKLESYLLPMDPSIQTQAWTSPQPFADAGYFTARKSSNGNSTA